MIAAALAKKAIKVAKRQTAFRGDRLKWLREAKKLTQEELTQILEIGQQQVSRYETDVSDPSPLVLAKIAKALDCTTDYLLGLSDDPESSQRANPPLTPKQKLLLAKYESGELEELALDILKEDVDRKTSTPKSPATNPSQ